MELIVIVHVNIIPFFIHLWYFYVDDNAVVCLRNVMLDDSDGIALISFDFEGNLHECHRWNGGQFLQPATIFLIWKRCIYFWLYLLPLV